MFKNLNPSLLGVSGHESEIIELALTYEFQGMDLEIEEFVRRAEKHGTGYARRLIDSAGLRLGGFELPIELNVEDDQFKAQLAKLPEYAAAAADVGCTRCLTVIQPAGDTRPYHENFEFHRHRFTDICGVLEPAGVRLGIGFRAADDLRRGQAFQFVHELEALTLLVKVIDAPNVGLFLDNWDLHVSGGSAESVRELSGEQIVAVRVADLPEEAPAEEVTEASRILPDPSGRIEVAGYLAALAEVGYDGPVTPAPAKASLKGLRRDAIVEKAARSLKEAWQAAGLTADGRPAVTTEG